MQAFLSLVRREIAAYFVSPIAYAVLALFLSVTGLLFAYTLSQLGAQGPRGVEYPMQAMLGLSDLQTIPGFLSFLAFWLVFLLIPALLTMRLLAGERSSGTLEMLLTSPLRDWQIVLAKFCACYALFIIMWLPTLVYLPALLDPDWENFAIHFDAWPFVSLPTGVDPWPFVTAYLGLALAGAMFLALGLFVSSLVADQLLAVVLSLFLNLAFVAGGFLLAFVGGVLQRTDVDTGSQLYQVLYYFTVPLHFERAFTRGQIDTRQLVLYLSVSVFCLFLTVRSLESRRWR
jgi:ABC-type transport system involved in multi-copper enzyme maturation permease subunit